MADLYSTIQADLKAALKSRSEVELGVLRLLKSDIQYEMNKTGADSMSDEDVLTMIKRAAKKRNEAIAQFKQGGRQDLADKEAAELEVLARYQPAELSDEEISKELDAVVAETKPGGMSDMGRVMGAVMGRLKGKNADGARVKALVQEKLKGL